jgi:uncharacterized protein (DUF1684 family)
MKIKFVVFTSVIVLVCTSSLSAQVDIIYAKTHPKYIKQVNKEYRTAMHLEFADSAQTPLTAEGLKHFKKICWYPIQIKYRVTAKLTLTPDELPFEMPRSKGNTGTYRKYGVATFVLNGVECSLSLYQYMKLINDEKYKDDLFLPFADGTNGDETYGSGRFIELKRPEGDTVIIDFNTAFNPLCAYNSKYSCPIPPAENLLPVEVKAGMKNYKGEH